MVNDPNVKDATAGEVPVDEAPAGEVLVSETPVSEAPQTAAAETLPDNPAAAAAMPPTAAEAADQAATASTEPATEESKQTIAPPAQRKAHEMTGVVSSSKADKTITVRVDRRVKHPVYGKFIRRTTKLAVHDPGNHCREGDMVTIIETRPISRTKSWRLGRIVERANV